MTIDQGGMPAAIRAWSRLTAVRLRTPRTNIFCAPSRSRRGSGWRLRRNWSPVPAAPNIAGAPAASCCSSCRSRPERAQTDLHPGDAPEGVEVAPSVEDDAWVQGRALLDTVEDIELIDPELSSERLAYRLFHEPGVRVFNPLEVRAQCSCGARRSRSMLKNFSQDDRDHMVEDGKISVTCEFCNSTYVFQPEDVGAKAG